MSASKKLRGVMLLSFGAPDSLEAVEPFMTNILGGRKPPPPLLTKMVERYRLIGGKSPLPETTAQQASLVERLLNTGGKSYKVYAAMLHWHPFIQETLAAMLQDGVEEVAAVSLSPHFAGVTTGAYRQAIDKALSELNSSVSVRFAPAYFDHPLLVEGLALKLSEALNKFPQAARNDVEVIFTAHSLPAANIQSGDPYVSQLEATVALVTEYTGLGNWHLAYQSKGGGQGEWLGPEVEEVMNSLAGKGRKNVVVAPVGFATDHIETLYDIDVAQRKHAQTLGLNFQRAEALNTLPQFIQVLAETALKAF